MEKNKIKTNALIKRGNLIKELREGGIERANIKAVLSIEKYFKDSLENIIKALKEEIDIQGRKTLKKEDVEKVLSKKQETFWEI